MSVRMCVYVLARSTAGGFGATGLVHTPWCLSICVCMLWADPWLVDVGLLDWYTYCDVCPYMYVCFGPCVLLPVMLVVSLCRAASTFTAVASKLGHLISVHALLM